MIEPKDGEWWMGKWAGTNFNCIMQYSAKTKQWHDHGVEASETNHSFEPLYKMVKAGGMENLESDYERGMREAMKDIAKSCGKTFSVDIGYLDLPKLVDELVHKNKPKPRTKVVYEKVESLLSCIDDHIEGKLYNKVGDEFRKCADCQKAVASTFLAGCLYRKVEKEIDWRDEVKRYFGRDDLSDYSLGYVIDRERVDAVSKGFIGMCHLVASLTDKPE